MNEQIELASRKRGIVINFPKLTESQLNNMINDVGLKLTVSQLKKLQTHYRRVEKRDPTLDELYFLGEYFSARDCRSHIVSDLVTNSRSIAETYADLMEKREAVIQTDEPPTIGELSELSAKYLESRGKSYPIDIKKKKKLLSHALVMSGRDASLRLISDGYATVCKTPIGAVGIKSAKKQKIGRLKRGDFILLISPTPEMSEKEFTARLADQILDTFGGSLKMLIPMGEQTIIDAVSSIPYGIYLDLDSLYDDDNSTSELDDLCRRPYGVMAIIRADDIVDILRLSTAIGLQTIVLGSLISKKHISVRHGNYPLVTFSRDLLKVIKSDSQLSIQHISGTVSGRLLANFRTLSRAHNISLSSAEAMIGESGSSAFITSLYTALTAIAQCVASGADYTDIAISYSIPKNISPSDTLAAILGIYRAEIELCIPDRAGRIGVEGDRLSVSAAGKLADGPIPALLCRPGNRVYLLLPRYNSEGLPDFEDMRRMWRYLRMLCAERKVSSAFATGHDGADATLNAITGNCDFIPSPDLDPSILKKCAAGGFIVETLCPIEGVLIGRSAEKAEISQ